MFCIIYLLTVTFTISFCKQYLLFEITAYNEHERSILYYKYSQRTKMYFLNGVTNQAGIPIIVIGDPCCSDAFKKFLMFHDIQFNIKFIDLPETEEILSNSTKDKNKFLTEEGVSLFVNNLTKVHSNVLKSIDIGTSFLQKNLTVLKLSTQQHRYSVFILSGEDARDWSSPAITMCLLTMLLDRNSDLYSLTHDYDFYFFILSNPDGYEYSTTKDRFWPKNRKENFIRRYCDPNWASIGVNIDRNWYYKEDDQDCGGIYLGPKALSEEETSSLASFASSIATTLMAFINIKGFNRLITIPFSIEDKHCNNYPVLIDLASAAVNKVKKKMNISLEIGTTGQLLYNLTGNSADWVKHELNVPLVYTLHLMYKNHTVAAPADSGPLSKQAAIILFEILKIGKHIYGPLFNKQTDGKGCLLLCFTCLINIIYEYVQD